MKTFVVVCFFVFDAPKRADWTIFMLNELSSAPKPHVLPVDGPKDAARLVACPNHGKGELSEVLLLLILMFLKFFL